MAYIDLKDVCIDFPIPKSRVNAGWKRSVTHTVGGKFGDSNGGSSVRALDSITLQLKNGDRIGLVGHNGAGKTTLLKMLHSNQLGSHPPTQYATSQVDRHVNFWRPMAAVSLMIAPAGM